MYIYWLVVFTVLKNKKVNGWWIIPYIMENKKCLKPPTSLNINMLVVDQPFHILISTDDISTHFELLKSLENPLLIDEISILMGKIWLNHQFARGVTEYHGESWRIPIKKISRRTPESLIHLNSITYRLTFTSLKLVISILVAE